MAEPRPLVGLGLGLNIGSLQINDNDGSPTQQTTPSPPASKSLLGAPFELDEPTSSSVDFNYGNNEAQETSSTIFSPSSYQTPSDKFINPFSSSAVSTPVQTSSTMTSSAVETSYYIQTISPQPTSEVSATVDTESTSTMSASARPSVPAFRRPGGPPRPRPNARSVGMNPEVSTHVAPKSHSRKPLNSVGRSGGLLSPGVSLDLGDISPAAKLKKQRQQMIEKKRRGITGLDRPGLRPLDAVRGGGFRGKTMPPQASGTMDSPVASPGSDGPKSMIGPAIGIGLTLGAVIIGVSAWATVKYRKKKQEAAGGGGGGGVRETRSNLGRRNDEDEEDEDTHGSMEKDEEMAVGGMKKSSSSSSITTFRPRSGFLEVPAEAERAPTPPPVPIMRAVLHNNGLMATNRYTPPVGPSITNVETSMTPCATPPRRRSVTEMDPLTASISALPWAGGYPGDETATGPVVYYPSRRYTPTTPPPRSSPYSERTRSVLDLNDSPLPLALDVIDEDEEEEDRLEVSQLVQLFPKPESPHPILDSPIPDPESPSPRNQQHQPQQAQQQHQQQRFSIVSTLSIDSDMSSCYTTASSRNSLGNMSDTSNASMTDASALPRTLSAISTSLTDNSDQVITPRASFDEGSITPASGHGDGHETPKGRPSNGSVASPRPVQVDVTEEAAKVSSMHADPGTTEWHETVRELGKIAFGPMKGGLREVRTVVDAEDPFGGARPPSDVSVSSGSMSSLGGEPIVRPMKPQLEIDNRCPFIRAGEFSVGDLNIPGLSSETTTTPNPTPAHSPERRQTFPAHLLSRRQSLSMSSSISPSSLSRNSEPVGRGKQHFTEPCECEPNSLLPLSNQKRKTPPIPLLVQVIGPAPGVHPSEKQHWASPLKFKLNSKGSNST